VTKTYDRQYFDRWYRSSRAVVRHDVVQRKVRLALAAAEHLLGRDVNTVLDVGCGEAPWRGILRRMRPELEYTGVDPSEYVVRRYGRRRNIIQGGLLELDELYLDRSYDLVVCSDVLQYLPNEDAREGLRLLARRTGGGHGTCGPRTGIAVRSDSRGWLPSGCTCSWGRGCIRRRMSWSGAAGDGMKRAGARGRGAG